ncbi:MAG: hypothetical protein ABIK09_12150 [Pseudomonadota bacterium]
MDTTHKMMTTLALAALLTGCGTLGQEQVAAAKKIPKGAMELSAQKTQASVADYRWYFQDKLRALPPATLAELPKLIRAFELYRDRAEDNFGRWVDGDIILGARPKEYQPSDDELMENELGARIQEVVAATPAAQIDWLLKDAGIELRALVYRAISFRTVRIAGVGAYHYASTPVRTTVTLVADDQIASR